MTSEEELKEYFNIEIIEPKQTIKIKRNKKEKIKVKMTSKKIKDTSTTVGGINIVINE